MLHSHLRPRLKSDITSLIWPVTHQRTIGKRGHHSSVRVRLCGFRGPKGWDIVGNGRYQGIQVRQDQCGGRRTEVRWMYAFWPSMSVCLACCAHLMFARFFLHVANTCHSSCIDVECTLVIILRCKFLGNQVLWGASMLDRNHKKFTLNWLCLDHRTSGEKILRNWDHDLRPITSLAYWLAFLIMRATSVHTETSVYNWRWFSLDFSGPMNPLSPSASVSQLDREHPGVARLGIRQGCWCH